MKINQKNAQLTLFVILGIMFLFIVLFFFSFLKTIRPPVKNPTDTIISEFQTGLVKEHINSCILTLASENLEKIGANGGYLYDFQGGEIPISSQVLGKDYLNLSYQGKEYFVQYGMRENDFCPLINYASPDYPYPGRSLSDLGRLYDAEPLCFQNNSDTALDGFFGMVTLPKLCNGLKDSSCKDFAKGINPDLTLQKQLASAIAKKLPDCVNLSSFSNDLDADLSTEGQPAVEVSFHENDVAISVSYPVQITYDGEDPIVHVFDYQAALNVRLGALYNFLYRVLSRDSRDYAFKLKDGWMATMYWKPGLEIRNISRACPNCTFPFNNDYVIEAIDSESNINGKPFYFRSAVRNRKPALDFLNDKTYDLADTGAEVNIPINAHDPDDEGLTYFFLSEGQSPGWHESPSSLVFDSNQLYLRFPLALSDYGDHHVGILVADSAGNFDFQFFSISVIDSSEGGAMQPGCIADCSAYGDSSLIPDCYAWCQKALDLCSSDCNLIDQSTFATDNACKRCVVNIDLPELEEPHPICSQIHDTSACINLVPDCFWIKELVAGGTVESCVDDKDLSSHGTDSYLSLDGS